MRVQFVLALEVKPRWRKYELIKIHFSVITTVTLHWISLDFKEFGVSVFK